MAVDTNSETWRAVEAGAKTKLAEILAELERQDTTNDRTCFLRGQASVCRNVLALASPPKPTPVLARDDHGMKVDGY